MASFPTRPSRSAFGPATLTNKYPVRDPSKEVGADKFALSYWTQAGAAGAIPLAWVLCTFTGPSTIALTAHFEAWDPNRTGTAPSVSRSGAGVYVVTYAASYPDENGTSIPTQLYGASVSPRGSASLNFAWDVASARIFTIRTFTSNTAAPTDTSFWAGFW